MISQSSVGRIQARDSAYLCVMHRVLSLCAGLDSDGAVFLLAVLHYMSLVDVVSARYVGRTCTVWVHSTAKLSRIWQRVEIVFFSRC